MDKVKLVSLNARGLKNKLKRNTIFNYLKSQNIDIACIQESHITEKEIGVWEKQWGGKIVFQAGTNHSKGELMLISKHFTGTVKIEKSQNRLLVLSVTHGNMSFVLVNVYAPNETKEKIRFFNVIQNILYEYRLQNLIIMGDFNCVMNNQMDNISGRPHSKQEIEQLNESVSALGTQDAWRICHPNEKEFTWCRHTPFIARRLDYCFVSDEVLPWLVSCEHLSVSSTDHKAVLIELNSNVFKRGPGHWRFNNSYLSDSIFVEKMNNHLKELLSNNDSQYKNNLDIKWEQCKVEIREFCIEYGRNKACKKKNELLKLQSELKEIERKLVRNGEDKDLQMMHLNLKQKIEVMQLDRARGAQVRARVKWIEEGEKNTKFFCNLEKVRARKNTITRLKQSSGNIIIKQEEIMQEQVNYYRSLYSQIPTERNIEESLLNFIKDETFPKLDNEEAELCDTDITLKEASNALSLMKNGSAPGCDGLTIEFMKFFWKHIGQTVLDSFKDSYKKGELSYSQRKGLIILLHKGDQLDRENLNNWRPITLTNSDYKILAKILALRLSCVIPKVVNEDQVGYLKGRNISTVIRTIDDVINYLNVTGKAGYLLALDYSKAFDSISKEYLIEVFKIFGFKNDFIRWVQILNNNTSSCINHGGWISEGFTVNSGIRQGCPFSPLAFILAVEVLAIKIRNSLIKGIQLPHPSYNEQSLKIKQYADDTTLFLQNKEDVDRGIIILNWFSQFSGLKLNREKTKIMKIGKNNVEKDLPFECVQQIKILGVYFNNYTMAKYIEANWLGKIEKVNNMIKMWSARDLSMLGKVLVIKTFLMSQFSFLMQSIGIPEKILTKINQIFYKFLWQRKFSNRKAFEKIKRKTLQKDYKEGGIQMIDMLEVQMRYYLQWAGKLASSQQENWSNIPKWHYSSLGSDLGVFSINCHVSQIKQLENVKNQFWETVLTTYLKEKSLTDIEKVDVSNVLNQTLFNNNLIQHKGSVLFHAEWVKKGLEKVHNIVSLTERRFLTLHEVQNIITTNKANVFFEYWAVINALPHIWKVWVRECSLEIQEENSLDRLIIFNTKLKNIKAMLKNKKDITQVPPYACYYWKRLFDTEINEDVWTMSRKATKEVRLLELQWKIVHRIYPTNIILEKMKIVKNNKCSYCPNEVDFLEHFYYECQIIKNFWNYVSTTLSMIFEKKIMCTIQDVLFGFQHNSIGLKEKQHINHVLLVGKMCISIVKKTNQVKALIPHFEFHLRLRKLDRFL